MKNLFRSCGYDVDDKFLAWTTQDVIGCYIKDKAYYAIKECEVSGYRAGLALDFMVHPEHRSAQILLDLKQIVHEKCQHLDFIFGFPNSQAVQPSKVFLGYEQFYAISVYQENTFYFDYPNSKPAQLAVNPSMEFFRWRYSKPGVTYYLVEGSILKIYQEKMGHILGWGGDLDPVRRFFEKMDVRTVSCWVPTPKPGMGHPFTLAVLPIKCLPVGRWVVQMGDCDVF